MDPPSLMNQGSYPSEGAAAAAFNLVEIWPLSINGGGGNVGRSEGGLELRRSHFGPSWGQFGDSTTSSAGDASRDVAGGGDNSVVAASQRARQLPETPVLEDDSSAKVVSTSGANGVNDCKGKRLKSTRSRDDSRDSKAEMEVNSGNNGVEQKQKQKHQLLEPPKQDFIHVRARRGQATDSHSLAERARREKISERMKILQDLVPGCNKVIGKALVLDEIINYIQSLQRQVEFLSMKLEAVNSRMNSGIEGFPLKDFVQQPYDPAGVPFSSQATRDYGRGSSPEWLHMQVGGAFDRTT